MTPPKKASNVKNELRENGYKERRSTIPSMPASGNYMTSKGRVILYPDNTYYILKKADGGEEGSR